MTVSAKSFENHSHTTSNTGGLRRLRRGGTSKYAVGIFDGEISLGGISEYPAQRPSTSCAPRPLLLLARICTFKSRVPSSAKTLFRIASSVAYKKRQESMLAYLHMYLTFSLFLSLFFTLRILEKFLLSLSHLCYPN